MKVVVTGAAGFIGTELVPVLRTAGHQLRVLVRTPLQRHSPLLRHSRESGNPVTDDAQTPDFVGSLATAASGAGIDCITGSLPDAALCKRLCMGMEVVVHAAGVAHITASAETLKTKNLEATIQLASAAKAQGVRKFVFLSSSKAHYSQHSAYGRLKAAAEKELRKLHEPGVFEVVCLRPALVYGRGMQGNLRSLLRVLSRRWLPVFPESNNSLGLISVQDLCRAVGAALKTEGLPDRVWELADGQRYTLTGLVREVRGTLGLGQPLFPLPRMLFWLLARLSEGLSPLIRSGLSLGTYHTLFDENYAHDPEFSRRTGFAPQDTFYSKLPELLEDLVHG